MRNRNAPCLPELLRRLHVLKLPARVARPFARLGLVALLVALLMPLAPAPAAQAVQTVALPFAGGQAVTIIQGYNGGTHQGRSFYGLDLVLAGGGTSGAEVLSPVEGIVAWAFAPGGGNGCMSIAFDGGYSVVMCHVMFHRSYRNGESIARGQSLGYVGPGGTVGNNGTPHVHLELYHGGAVPFSPPAGLLLDGMDLPATGRYNDHGGDGPIVSSNGIGSDSQTLASSEDEDEDSEAAEVASAAPAELPQQPTVAAAPTDESGSVSVEAAAHPTAARTARVQGTDSCLKVRAEPSLDSEVVDCLPDGTEVPLTAAVEEVDGQRWRQIEGKGWVAAEFLERGRVVVSGTDSCLNVRAEPTADAEILTCLPEGSSVSIVEGPVAGADQDWYRVQPASDDPSGWVAGTYLS